MKQYYKYFTCNHIIQRTACLQWSNNKQQQQLPELIFLQNVRSSLPAYCIPITKVSYQISFPRGISWYSCESERPTQGTCNLCKNESPNLTRTDFAFWVLITVLLLSKESSKMQRTWHHLCAGDRRDTRGRVWRVMGHHPVGFLHWRCKLQPSLPHHILGLISFLPWSLNDALFVVKTFLRHTKELVYCGFTAAIH